MTNQNGGSLGAKDPRYNRVLYRVRENFLKTLERLGLRPKRRYNPQLPSYSAYFIEEIEQNNDDA